MAVPPQRGAAASEADDTPSAQNRPERGVAELPAELPTESSGSGERFVEEELPPGFWEEANEPEGPSRPAASAAGDMTRLPEPAPAAPAGNRAIGEDTGGRDTEPVPDRAFTDLQQLFPGRIIAIEAHDNDGDAADAASEEPANEENDDDGTDR